MAVGRPLAVGQLRRNVLLGSEAIYRIVEWDGSRVEVEVVDAPGLVSGLRLGFTLEAVLGMLVVSRLESEMDDEAGDHK